MSIADKIFIVDDDEAMRHALSMLLKAAGYSVEAFASAAAFLDAGPRNCGCLVLDVSMPEMDGPTLQAELSRRGVSLPIIFLSGNGTIPTAVSTIKAGALDFLTKPVDGGVLISKIKEALARNQKISTMTDEYLRAASLLERLSAREQEIMMLAVAGQSNKEIARKLGISFRTVEVHRSHIMKKTGVANLLELARIISPLHNRETLP